MTLFQRILSTLFPHKYSAPVPAPTPAPVVVTPVLPPPLEYLSIFDTRSWNQENNGWYWAGARIEYHGDGGSSLESPPQAIPLDTRTLKIGCTVACDNENGFEAKGGFSIIAVNARGGTVYTANSPLISTGNLVEELVFPESAVEFRITLHARTQRKGGTSDGDKLIPRFVNLGCVK